MSSTKKMSLKKVEPINKIKTGDGAKYSYEYSYSEVYVDDIPDDFESDVSGSEFWWERGDLWYQYGDKPKVAIREDGAYCREDVYEKQGNQQAYYALSILSQHGYVGRFMKQ
jgi:hypothetical protein